MPRISCLARLIEASSIRLMTLGATIAARMPRMTTTTMISMSVKPAWRKPPGPARTALQILLDGIFRPRVVTRGTVFGAPIPDGDNNIRMPVGFPAAVPGTRAFQSDYYDRPEPKELH